VFSVRERDECFVEFLRNWVFKVLVRTCVTARATASLLPVGSVREAGIIVHIIVFWKLLLSKGVGVKLHEERTSEEEDV